MFREFMHPDARPLVVKIPEEMNDVTYNLDFIFDDYHRVGRPNMGSRPVVYRHHSDKTVETTTLPDCLFEHTNRFFSCHGFFNPEREIND